MSFMTMASKRLACLFLLLSSAALFAQPNNTYGNISAGASTCTPTSCVYFQIPPNTPWLVINVSGTWAGVIQVQAINSPTATYQNLNSQPWTLLNTFNSNGSVSVAAGGATFVLVQSSTWTSGAARVSITSSLTGDPLANPVFQGNVTAAAYYDSMGKLIVGGGTIGSSSNGQVLLNLNGSIGGTDLSAGLYNNGWSMDAENTFTGIYGVGCLGDSNCAGFGTVSPGTAIGSTNWINQMANDIGGGIVFNYAFSGDNPSNAATKAIIAIPNLPATGNPIMVLDIGENTARQGHITPAWTQAYIQNEASAASWAALPGTAKYLAQDSTKWTPSGSWAVQQVLVRSDVGLVSSGWGYQTGDVVQAVCPSGTALSFRNGGNFPFPLAGTIGGGNSGYTPGTYTNVGLTGGSGTGALANITVGGGGNVTAVTIVPVFTSRGGYVIGDVLSISVGGGTNATYTATAVGGPWTAGSFAAFGNNLCSTIGGVGTYNTAPVNLGSGLVITLNYGAIQPLVSSTSGNTLTTVLPVEVGPQGVGYLTYTQWADAGGTFTVQEDGGAPLLDTYTQRTTLTAQYDPHNQTLCGNQLGMNFIGVYPTGTCTPSVGSSTPNAPIARFVGLTPGLHNFTITQTSNGKIGIVSLEFPPSSHYRGAGAPATLVGGLKPLGFGDQTAEEYYSKLNEQVAIQLIGDGLNTPFFKEDTLDPVWDFLSAQVALVSDCSLTAGVGHFDFAPLTPVGVNQYFPGWVGFVNTTPGLIPVFSGPCAPFNGAFLTTLQSGLTPTAFNFNYVPASSIALTGGSSNGSVASVTNSDQNFLFPGWTGVVGGFSGALAPLNNATPITILSSGFSQSGFSFAYTGSAIAQSNDTGTLTSVVTGNLALSNDTGSFVPSAGNTWNGATANTGNQQLTGHLSTGPNGGTAHMAGLAEAAVRSIGFTNGTTALGGGIAVTPTATGLPGIGVLTNAGALHTGTGWLPGAWNYADPISGIALGIGVEPITAVTSFQGPSVSAFMNTLVAPTVGGTAFLTYTLTPGTLPATPSLATINELFNANGLTMYPTGLATSGANKASTAINFYPCVWNGTTPDCTHFAQISMTQNASGASSGNIFRFWNMTSTPANTGDYFTWLVGGPLQHGWKIDEAVLASTFDINWLAPTMTSTIAMPTQTSSGFPITASLTTTAATTDIVALTGMVAGSGGHCAGLAPTNASAATNLTSTYISAKAANQITVTHPVTAGMTFDIVCFAF